MEKKLYLEKQLIAYINRKKIEELKINISEMIPYMNKFYSGYFAQVYHTFSSFIYYNYFFIIKNYYFP